MHRFSTAILLLSTFAVGAFGQDGELKSDKPARQVVKDDSPVTCLEAHKVLAQVQIAMEQALIVKAAPHSKITPTEKAVTREQVLDELDRLERRFQPNYTLKPRTQYNRPAVVKFSTAERARAMRLIKLGFLSPVGPLVVGPADNLTVRQFSDAVAYFIERWSDMTHMPSVKWSPDLQPTPPMLRPPSGPQAPAR